MLEDFSSHNIYRRDMYSQGLCYRLFREHHKWLCIIYQGPLHIVRETWILFVNKSVIRWRRILCLHHYGQIRMIADYFIDCYASFSCQITIVLITTENVVSTECYCYLGTFQSRYDVLVIQITERSGCCPDMVHCIYDWEPVAKCSVIGQQLMNVPGQQWQLFLIRLLP